MRITDVGAVFCWLVARDRYHSNAWADSLSEQPPIYIVEQHGSAARFWFEELGHPGVLNSSQVRASVLHVDSHSDMLSNTWDSDFDALKGGSLQDLAATLLRDTNIGDFISSAMFAQLTDDIVWLRSDFPRGEYNAPQPGKHQVAVGMSRKRLKKYKDGDQILCFKTIVTWSHPPNETVANSQAEALDSCSSKRAPYNARIVNVTVSTLPHILPQQRTSQKPLLAYEKWILDIDLDFFSTSDPSLALFANYGFEASWVVSHVQHSLQCDNRNTLLGITSVEDMLEKVVSFFHRLDTRYRATLREARRLLRKLGQPCKIQAPKLQKLLFSLARFSPAQRSAWSQLWSVDIVENWTGDFLTSMFVSKSTISPHHLSSERHINHLLGQFNDFITSVVTQHRPPAVITISRSMGAGGHYLPAHDLNLVEDGVLKILKRILDRSRLDVMCYLGSPLEEGFKIDFRRASADVAHKSTYGLTPNCHLDRPMLPSDALGHRHRHRRRSSLEL